MKLNKEGIVYEKYQDKYLLKLSISDHLRECINLYDIDYKKNKKIDDLEKELADLYILLYMYFEDDGDKINIVSNRINKFHDKCLGEK